MQDSKNEDWRAVAAELLRNLADLQMRNVVTTQMVPVIYGLGIALVIAIDLALIVSAFQKSLITGLFWLLIIAPVILIAGVTAIRVGLEFFVSVFRIAVIVERLGTTVERVGEHTEDIHEATNVLPRITFWRSRKREAPAAAPTPAAGEEKTGAGKTDA